MPGTELDAAIYLAFFATAPGEGDDEDVDAFRGYYIVDNDGAVLVDDDGNKLVELA